MRLIGVMTTLGEQAAADSFGALYAAHRVSLVRLAALLLHDSAHAEDVVQDAYVSCHRALPRLRDSDAALAYLRRAVINGARSAVRRRMLAVRHTPARLPDMPSAEAVAYAALERDEVIKGLRALSRRHREALVLRYYGGLTETEAATAMGCSIGSVKAYTSRGLAALAARLEGMR
jgi:RNA polymerase sigma-70 factor (sigma-E family)